jgi:hypothetical protein
MPTLREELFYSEESSGFALNNKVTVRKKAKLGLRLRFSRLKYRRSLLKPT